jgi:hypothetical protein
MHCRGHLSTSRGCGIRRKSSCQTTDSKWELSETLLRASDVVAAPANQPAQQGRDLGGARCMKIADLATRLHNVPIRSSRQRSAAIATRLAGCSSSASGCRIACGRPQWSLIIAGWEGNAMRGRSSLLGVLPFSTDN